MENTLCFKPPCSAFQPPFGQPGYLKFYWLLAWPRVAGQIPEIRKLDRDRNRTAGMCLGQVSHQVHHGCDLYLHSRMGTNSAGSCCGMNRCPHSPHRQLPSFFWNTSSLPHFGHFKSIAFPPTVQTSGKLSDTSYINKDVLDMKTQIATYGDLL